MTHTGRLKKTLVLLLATLLLAVFALPALAASARVERVLEQLDMLMRVDISPQWLPDIEANQTAVQTLLDLYTECTDAEKGEFTAQQNADLRAYFVALYTAQGKDTAGVDALFTTGPPASSSSSVPSSSSESSSLDPSSTPSSSSSKPPASSSVPSSSASLPGSVVSPTPSGSGSASLPSISNPPQTPGNDGWAGFFGSGTLGTLLIILIAGLIIILFLWFLASLRKAGRVSKTEQDADFRTQELFGENYDPDLPDGRLKKEDDATDKAFPAARPAATVTPRRPADAKATEKPQPPPTPVDDAPKKEKRAEKTGFGRAKPAAPEETPETPPAPLKPPVAAPTAPAKEATPAGNPSADIPTTKPAPKDAAPAGPAKAAPPDAKPSLPDPDAPNAISLRGFGAQPRTGRPNKMPFRQGSPDDIDGVDE